MNRIIAILTFFSFYFVLTMSVYAQWEQMAISTIPNNYPTANYPTSMEWPDSNTGFVFSRYGGYFYKSSDAGKSWELDSIPNVPRNTSFLFSSCDFKTSELGSAVYKYDARDTLLYITLDGGRQWNSVHLTSPSAVPTLALGFIGRLRMDNKSHLYFMFGRTDDAAKKVMVEIDISKDLGESWDVYCTDTLTVDEETLPHDFIVIDSLTMIYFVTMTEAGDTWRSYAKYTTNGGRSWQILLDPIHPLAKSNLNNIVIDQIECLNDTAYSVRCSYKSGINIRIISRDWHNILQPSGWLFYAISGNTVLGNLEEIRGTKYIHISEYKGGSFIDSVIATREGPPLRRRSAAYPDNFHGTVFKVNEYGAVWIAGQNVATYENELYRLNEKLVSIEDLLDATSHENDIKFDIFPSPSIAVSSLPQAVIESNITLGDCDMYIYDNMGRLIASSEFKYETPGSKKVLRLPHAISSMRVGYQPGQYYALFMASGHVIVKRFVLLK